MSEIVGDRFVIRELLGTGAMGVVYRAHDCVRRMDVALKILRRIDGATLFRFKNEFRSLTDIVHPNLVTLYELFNLQGSWCFTMALVPGCSFLQYVRPQDADSVRAQRQATTEPMRGKSDAGEPGSVGARPAGALIELPASGTETPDTYDLGARALRTGTKGGVRRVRQHAVVPGRADLARLGNALPQVAVGVQALHDAGRLHRDLKPSNVLVEPNGHLCVCDFGLVAEVSAPEYRKQWNANLVGTPAYMSPEQAAGVELTPASDWYAVGVMLYEALTGALPLDGSMTSVLEEKQKADMPSPAELDPSLPADLCDLCERLLRRDPARRASGTDILDLFGRGSGRALHSEVTSALPSEAFVGRARSLEALRRALRDSRLGRSVAVLIRGSSGCGKTALVHRFLSEAALGDDTVVLQGRCYERESVPFKALDALVDSLSVHLMGLYDGVVRGIVPRDIAALTRLFPVLLRVRSIARLVAGAPVPADPHESRERAFGALRTLIARVATMQPTVLFIDDLHWGDVDSATFLLDVIHNAVPPPVLLLGTYRTEEADSSPMLRALLGAESTTGTEGDLRQMELAALSLEEATNLAAVVLGGRCRGAREQAEAIAREARGHALYVVELARNRCATDVDETTEPTSLDQLLGQRVARLPGEARDLLTAAAVAGRPIALSVVSRAAGIRDEPGALARLVAGHFVRTRRAGNMEEIEPYHDRVREVVVERLSQSDTRRFHREIARSLESSERLDAPALVEHWLAAGDRIRAAHYAELAALKASEALAFDRAAHHYRLLLELREMSELERSEVQRLLADALALAGRLDEAAEAYLSAAEVGDQRRQLELRRRALEQLLRHGRLRDGLELAKGVLREVSVSLPRTRIGTLLSILSRRAWLAVRGLEFRPKPPDQIETDAIVRLDSYWSMTTGLSFVDPFYGTSVATRYLVEALGAGDTYRAALAMTSELGYLSTGGTRNVKVCERLAVAARDLAERSGQPHAVGLYYAMHGLSYYLRGAFRSGHDTLLEGERTLLAQTVGARWEIDTCQLFRMATLLYLGQLKQLTRLVPELLAHAVNRGDEYLATGLRSWRSNLAWLALDEPDEARRQTLEADQVQQRKRGFHLHHYYRLLANAQIDLYCGNAEVAWQRVTRHWRDLKRSMLLRVQSVEIEGTFLRGRCALALAAAGNEAPRPLIADANRCTRRLLKTGAAWAVPLACLLRGTAADLQGDTEAAVAAFSEALRSCEENEMRLHEAVARYRLGQLLGGEGGRAQIASAIAWMQSEAVANPGAMVALFAPAQRLG